MFESGITTFQGYLDDANLCATNCGTRSSKLELIDNRMKSQKTTFETLKICIRTGSSLLQSLDLGLHILQIHYILHGLYQIVHRTSDTVLEALICSGIHLNGLVETYIIFDACRM